LQFNPIAGILILGNQVAGHYAMSIIIGIATIFCLFLAVSIVLVGRQLVRDVNLPAEADWMEELSPQRYRPLERLLDEREYWRLKAHPAITPKMLRTMRSRRIRIFRGYLSCLSVDYGRVCKTVKLLMVQSPRDRPDLASLLVRQHVTFTVRLAMAQFCLTLHALGIGGMEAAKLVAALESMRVELNGLMAATQPSAA
jgi:hypothetical protein